MSYTITQTTSNGTTVKTDEATHGLHVCSRCKKSYTSDEWEALPGAINGREWAVTESLVLEMRNCSCGGTMGFDPLPPVLQVQS